MRRALFVAAIALCMLHPAPARSSDFLKRRMKDWQDELKKSDKSANRSAAAFALGRMGRDAEDARQPRIKSKPLPSGSIRSNTTKSTGPPLAPPPPPARSAASAAFFAEITVKPSRPST